MPDHPIVRVITDQQDAFALLTRRHGFEGTNLSDSARQGIRRIFGQDLSASQVVDLILEEVRTGGDEAVRSLTARIDGGSPESLEVPKSAWEMAYAGLEPALQDALQTAASQIASFHEKQNEHPGSITTTRVLWVNWCDHWNASVYAPGGTAVYPSSLLMTAIPARVAGVGEIIVCSPPHSGVVSPLILAAAWVARVDRLFQIGGAQAIAAMAYGTETVPHVDKILGPGNIFAVLAKRKVFGVVDIDQLPGPTETLIVADASADPRLTAADMIAQAEHDAMASAILVTTSAALADAVQNELETQLESLPRGDIALASPQTNGLIIIAEDVPVAMDLANCYAPEHLCLLLADPWSAVPLVRHAGGIFVGEHSPEALGDYTAGPSHVMPTGGTARFSSPIHLNDFVKVISIAAANTKAIKRLGPATIALANAEGLHGHARAIEYRLESMD
ncbi:MAG: histidinol dehydrogenase [Thermomicrobiales bacterium]